MPIQAIGFSPWPSCIRLIRVYWLVTNLSFDCVEIGLARTTSSDQISILTHSSSKVNQNLHASILYCLFADESCWTGRSLYVFHYNFLCSIFCIRSYNPNLVLQRRCVLLYERFHENKFATLSVTSSEYPGRPEEYFEWDLPQVLSLFATLKKAVLQGTLCGVLWWYSVPHERRIAETFSPTQCFLVMKRNRFSLKVEFARSAILCNLNSFSLKLTNVVVKIRLRLFFLQHK